MATQKVVVEGSSVTASQLKDLFRQIEDGGIGASHMQAFLEHRDPWQNGSASGRKSLLGFVTSAPVAAIESFESTKNFKEGKKGDAQIYWLGDNFKKHFGRKVEGVSEAAEIKIHKLLESSLDAPIIVELADTCEITLGQLFALLKKQGKGEPGQLLVNGWANIAYIRDDGGRLWAVYAAWDAGHGWRVEARSVERPLRWRGGNQVLSR